MKTAISIPDDLFQRADRLARHERKSRSQVYSEAVRAWLDRRESEAVTRALDAAEAAARTDQEDGAWIRQAAASLARSEWEP